jgi:hypothetical protein
MGGHASGYVAVAGKHPIYVEAENADSWEPASKVLPESLQSNLMLAATILFF